MIYIDATPNTSGAYPNPKNQPFPGCIPLTDEQAKVFFQYNGFVTVSAKEDEYEEGFFRTVYTVEPNTEAWKADHPDPLVEAKAARVAQSKADLETYLDTHPITWTNGQQYSITQERQNQLMGTIAAAQIDGLPPEWNTTGGMCRAWDLAELCNLAVAIKNRVKALVKYQQAQEIAINAAQTQEDLDAIVVDYDTVEASL